MSQDEFSKLFTYMEDFRKDVDRRFELIDERFDRVDRRFDAQAKIIEDNHQELMALVSKVDRHEGWIKGLAKHTGAELATG